ncbi:unnamed protein product [Rotaria sordida]|uniref:CAP-Gly domain-containing protein n=1 Tax=Rotaria sordida TaxID=392033 RepID=A0A819IXK9_9BILA|nr:unnamed protein product [Rotaria sordida]
MSVPVAPERKSLLPLRLPAPCVVAPRPTIPMPSVCENNPKSSLTVGNRVLVNGLKSGILRYIGTVKFADGQFCGVELDQPDGKHDGQIKDVRYFQCPPNHGIFVPCDKVVLAPRLRTSLSQRPISRLKPPTMTRSMTHSSEINKIEQSKSVELPDLLANTTSQPVILNNSIVNDHHEIIIPIEQPQEQTIDVIESKLEFQPLTTDEPSETIEADFTDSVSLILHQLQQEKPIETRSSSIIISEEDTEDDDDDELDNESIIESTINEKIDTTCHSSSPSSSICISIESTKFVQTDLSFHSNDNISFTKNELIKKQKSILNLSTSINKLEIKKKDEQTIINKKKPIIQSIKKNVEQRSIPPLSNTTKRPITSTIPRKSSIILPKKGPPSKIPLNAAQSVTSLSSSQSKHSLSLSSCNSLNSSQSDLGSITKNSNIKKTSDTNQNIFQSSGIPSINLEKQIDQSRDQLNTLNQQMAIQKSLNQSLEITNQHLKKYYQHLLNQFDLMHILSQYYINENEQIKEQHEIQLSKARTTKDQLEISIEHLQTYHKNELSVLDKRYHSQIETLNKTHEQKLNEYKQKMNHLLHEKNELESCCSLLQEKVDSFLTEMANSEHADILLCHVETLEKDRTSLQTVLELKTKEITQLRTKLNEQEIRLHDEQALRKRVDMVENKNQNLEYLLQHKKLSEKSAIAERNELKEQVIQLERDNCQLKFENETLRYRLHERSLSISIPLNNQIIFPNKSITIPIQKLQGRNRACSLSSIIIIAHKNECITRSLSSLNCIS